MKYLFILGRNPKLSTEEVFAFLRRLDYKISSFEKRDNALLVEIDKPLDGGSIDILGGVMYIGQVISSGLRIKDILKSLEKQEVYSGESNKFNFLLWKFTDEESFEEIREYLKDRFRAEKLKANEKKIYQKIKGQGGEKFSDTASNLIDEQYFIFGENNYFFGKIIQKCDYKAIEKRDMERPVRREALAISPRLAKIMINLSEIKEGGKILDPFCGIGVVLQEALLQELSAVGIDNDKSAILSAEKNFQFLKLNPEKYSLIHFDSTQIKLREEIDSIATEPDLGILLKKTPTQENAKFQLRGFENLMINTINNLKSKVKGKIVFTSPLIKTFSSRIGIDGKKIEKETGKEISKGFPIDDFREDSIVGRRIFVLK